MSFKIYEIEGDGNCLFSSVIHQIILNGHSAQLKMALGLSGDVEITQEALRSSVTRYLTDSSKPWEADLGAYGEEVRIGALDNIRHNRAWCGNVELICVLSFLKQHGLTYQTAWLQDMEKCNLDASAAADTKPCRALQTMLEGTPADAPVLAFGHLYNLHWDSLTTADGKSLTPDQASVIVFDGLFDHYDETGSTAPVSSKPKSPFLEAGPETKKDENPKYHGL